MKQPYIKNQYSDLWKLILDLKKELDENQVLYIYFSLRQYKITIKNKLKRTSYEIASSDYFFTKNKVPYFFIGKIPDVNTILLWIKDNSKAIDTVNTLKAFT